MSIYGVLGTVLRAAGDAEAGHVLEGRTFSNASEAGVGGAMPDRGAVSITPGTTEQTIAEGYHNGSGTVAGDGDLASGNIKSGVEIFGVGGSVIQATGNAAAADVLSGRTFSNAGAAGVSGAMPDNGAVSVTPGTSAQTIAEGYHNGSGSVAGDADLVSGNIKSGVEIFSVNGSVIQALGNATAAGDVLTGKTFSNASAAGVSGAMANNAAVSITPGTADQTIAAGYHNGSGTVAGDEDLASGNIKSGVEIFGVVGDSNVVDTSSGDAVAEDIADGKIAWVDGTEITGTASAGGTCTQALAPRTGQTTSYGTGDDGELQKGLEWPSAEVHRQQQRHRDRQPDRAGLAEERQLRRRRKNLDRRPGIRQLLVRRLDWRRKRRGLQSFGRLLGGRLASSQPIRELLQPNRSWDITVPHCPTPTVTGNGPMEIPLQVSCRPTTGRVPAARTYTGYAWNVGLYRGYVGPASKTYPILRMAGSGRTIETLALWFFGPFDGGSRGVSPLAPAFQRKIYKIRRLSFMFFSKKLSDRYRQLKKECADCILLMQVGAFMHVRNENKINGTIILFFSDKDSAYG